MALDIEAQDKPYSASGARPLPQSNLWPAVRRLLMPLASLKLTVALFSAAIFLVFAGTLAQKEVDVWDVIEYWFRIDERNLISPEFPYFHPSELFVRIPLRIFCIDLLWPSFIGTPDAGDLGLWFPRGWLIGLLMGINLLAAHTVRFTVQTRGARLLAGLGILALGCVATYAAIESGSSEGGILGGAIFSWETIWKLLLVGLAACGFLSGAYAFLAPSDRMFQRIGAGVFAVVSLLCVAGAIYYQRTAGQAFLHPESMRILWQLLKGGCAGLILLAGCVLVFKKRAGIVLLHGGIGLIFLYEVVVGTSHKESQMTIVEGESSNWTQDVHSPELAVILPGANDDLVTTIPKRLLGEGSTVSNEQLPFDFKIVKYYRNANIRRKGPFEPTQATAGAGTSRAVVELPPSVGASGGGEVDTPAAFIELLDKRNGGKSVGTYLVSVLISSPQRLPIVDPKSGKPYEIAFRFRREYKPYTIAAKEVRADHYVASSRPKNYSSTVRVLDPTRNIDREELIRMNSPMRFAGETFYQSGYKEIEGHRVTTLQVVDNAGWMLPYVSCMIVGVGMLAQFGGVLSRFLARRRQAPLRDVAISEAAASVERPGKRGKANKAARAASTKFEVEGLQLVDEARAPGSWWMPALIVGLIVVFFGYTARPMGSDDRGMQLGEFAKLPIAADARVKPYDALARSTLVYLSQKQTFKLDPSDKNERAKPAIRWLLDVMAGVPAAEEYKVFRIENDDVVRTLGIEPNSNLSYSWKQLFEKKHPGKAGEKELSELEYQLQLSAEKEQRKETGAFERELGELESRIMAYRLLLLAFDDPARTLSFDAQKIADDSDALERKVHENAIRLLEMVSDSERLKTDERKLALAVHLNEGNWESAFDAQLQRFIRAPEHKLEVDLMKVGIDRLMETVAEIAQDQSVDQATMARLQRAAKAALKFHELVEARDAGKATPGQGEQKYFAVLDAYRAGDAAKFNAAVADYHAYVKSSPPAEYDRTRRNLEAVLLVSEPFFWCSYIYIIGGLAAVIAWLAMPRGFNRAATWIVATAFVYHTFALILRMYVTERPPVVNLYSSAVFIGWAAVLMGLIVDRVYRNGIGIIVAAISGFGSLQIAHLLSRQGDTIEALQAVLDTQFWLTTHVVCITKGYSATFVAGILGAVYIIKGVLTPSLDDKLSKDIARMIYGILCYALFLSFVGTVLGGLWADDSWGRFWGWDPKENGALIIVLWNALVLHARWDGMIKERGLAVLAVAGNITTSWSWFGVNQLGVGLHAYGFSKELRMFLTLFVVGSMVTIVLGLLPKQFWLSGKSLTKPA